MNAGDFDRRITIRRRADLGEGERGDFADAFKLWANVRMTSATEAVQGGRLQDLESGTVTVRDGTQARSITIADRLVLTWRGLSSDFAIVSVAPPDRRTATIAIGVQSRPGG
jgi:head-tail adaptor